ncbi:MAG: YgiQ family radical SAM protein [Oligoflexia bacterium]|nr:YgiQ family radical SAM protein [Oligoflexia bacterium]
MSEKSELLPTTKDEMNKRGWNELDILLITGDAYIDHPTFGIPLLGRVLEKKGYRVGIIAQPDWRNFDDITRMGTPKLFCGVSAGSMDSMINKYTALKRLRDYDAYTPGGSPDLRPERATIVFTNLARKAFPGLPVIIGGIEASLRRFTHFDYWDNKIRRSILFDSRADLLCHGMSEKTILEIAHHFKSGGTVDNIPPFRGTARIHKNIDSIPEDKRIVMASFEEIQAPLNGTVEEINLSHAKFNKSAVTIERESNPHNAKILIEPCQGRYVVAQLPVLPLSTKELDDIYELPFTKRPHPMYVQPIPAYEVIKFSVQTNRGCFGGCSFCAITLQQGREIQSRSPDSLKKEVEKLKNIPGWAGTITDLGGPSANMYKLTGKDESICKLCKKMSCLFPKPCFNLDTDQTPQIEMMRMIRKTPGVKHVFIASGIRYDLALQTPEYIKEVTQHHTGGVMSVAPEHTDPMVLKLMKKPPIEEYNKFVEYFNQYSKEAGKKQMLSPYFISSFPGSDLNKTSKMSEYFKANKMRPEQIQDFIPSPMTLATAMYYTEKNPHTNEPIYIEKAMSKRKLQKRTLQSFLPQNRFIKARDLRKKGKFPRTYIASETETLDGNNSPLDING